MVWDRKTKRPAKIDGQQAAGLSKERAVEIEAELAKFYPPRLSVEGTQAGRTVGWAMEGVKEAFK